jgi:hypothetical protein
VLLISSFENVSECGEKKWISRFDPRSHHFSADHDYMLVFCAPHPLGRLLRSHPVAVSLWLPLAQEEI